MSGHSKWASIKHKKGALDAKRGKLFSKLIKEISVAARSGGGDISSNAKLRTILEKARAANMPNDNIERAIKRGTGQLEGVQYEEATFEGYGPGGIAILVETLTDNRNRTVAELRNIFNKGGGSLGESGCVGWMFTKRGVLTFERKNGEEKIMNTALEAGAEDIKEEEDLITVLTDLHTFESVKAAFLAQGLTPLEASVQMIPQNTIQLTGDDAVKMLRFLEAIEDHEDVQNVAANFDIDTATMENMV